MLFDYVYGENVESLYSGVTAHIERITRPVAERMLEANVNNRNRPNEPIADDLKMGGWSLNGATIVFADDGTLLDGQTRLSAVVESGVPIDTLVVRGIKKNAQVSMDSGDRRTVAHNLQMMGYKNCKALQAVGTGLLLKDKLGFVAVMNRNIKRLPTGEVVRFVVQQYERVESYTDIARNFTQRYRRVRLAYIATVAEELYKASPDDAEEFFSQLQGSSKPCQPVMMLQVALNKNAAAREGGLPQKTLMAMVVKAWNAYMRGEEIGTLRFRTGGARPEEFPAIVGADL